MKIITDMLGAIEQEEIKVALGTMEGRLGIESLHIAIGTYRGLQQARQIIENLLKDQQDHDDNL